MAVCLDACGGSGCSCSADPCLEVDADGPGGFVDRMVAIFDIALGEAPPVPSTSTTLEAEPVFGEPVGVVLIFDDGIDGVFAVDLDGRVGSRSVIEGQRAGDQPYRLTRVDGHFVVGWGTIYVADIATRVSAHLGEATIYVPAVGNSSIPLSRDPRVLGELEHVVEQPSEGQPV